MTTLDDDDEDSRSHLPFPEHGEHADHCLSNSLCHSIDIHPISRSKGREDQLMNPIIKTSSAALLFYLLVPPLQVVIDLMKYLFDVQSRLNM
jgi:hypothetical protein